MLRMKALNPTNTMNTKRLLVHNLTVLDRLQQLSRIKISSDIYTTVTYLLIEGEVLKADNTRYAYADFITLTNNGLLYLFFSLKLALAGQTVEHVNYSGQTTSLLGLASYSTTFSNGCGLTQGWYPDTNTNVAVNNGGFNTRQG